MPHDTIARQRPGSWTPPPGSPERESPQQAILIIRLSTLGDVALASAVIDPLRRRYPHARHVWLVYPEAEPLIAGNRALDAVITIPHSQWGRLLRRGRWLRLAREGRAFIRRLRAERFDLALDLQGLWKSAIWARLAAVPQRIGVAPREGSSMLVNGLVERNPTLATPGGEYDALLWRLGADRVRSRLGIAPTRAAREAAKERLIGAELTRGFIALCPFTKRRPRQWPVEHWAALATRLHEEARLPVVLFGGPRDHAAAARILAAPGGEGIIDWTGATDIGEAAALLARAALVIGVDTSLTHIAAGQGRPTVALFGATRPWRAPVSLPIRVLGQNPAPAPSGPRSSGDGARTSGMQEIAVGEVLTTAHTLLDRRVDGVRSAMERRGA
ncbi:glycosyltransferase family 9 protein [Halofilum ochraceum]|uniref:glycosyltransferase family 9 protein n=1 Tax=Halofilum ochraceum TaxID=1611323 RepID=UPI0015866BDE|nr:glycosyltransferase family 9 protein [Halofilum ochraceum]